jgi:hypothetical protein
MQISQVGQLQIGMEVVVVDVVDVLVDVDVEVLVLVDDVDVDVVDWQSESLVQAFPQFLPVLEQIVTEVQYWTLGSRQVK